VAQAFESVPFLFNLGVTDFQGCDLNVNPEKSWNPVKQTRGQKDVEGKI
jgi:hypothetical protein